MKKPMETVALIISDLFSQSETVDVIDTLHNIKDHSELMERMKAVIPMTMNNGVKAVEPEFQKMVLQFDPLYEAEKMASDLGFNKDEIEKATFSWGIMNIAIISAIKTVIKEITMDFSERDSTWDEYVNGVLSLGFEEIFEAPKKDSERDDITKLFWHKEYSILWVLGSFTWTNKDERKVNDSNIYLHGKTRGEDRGFDLPLSRGVAYNTDIVHMNCDMREMPTYKFFEILRVFEPVQYWSEFDCYSKTLSENLYSLPKEIVDKMVNRITSHFDFEHHKFLVKSDMHNAVDKFISELTIEQKKRGMAWMYLFGYENIKPSQLPSDLIELLSTYTEVHEYSLGYASSLLLDMRRNKDFTMDMDNYCVDSFSKEELQPLLDRLIQRKQSLNSTFFDESAYERLVDKCA